jgi:ABC-2 type transport system ATP-binding protein
MVKSHTEEKTKMEIEKKAVIRINQLSKSFGDVHALRGVSLDVPENSIFGFLGPNGAGKTTLMKILMGLSRPTSGGGQIFGRDIVSDNVAIRERIGFLPQHPRFIDHLTARENLHYTAGFYFDGPETRINERVEEMLELVGLKERADRPVRGFSGGEKQRLGIALAQVHYPDLLILDEPASALDPIGRQEVLEVMARLRKHATIFYSTHILDDVQRVSDSVAILNHGELVVSGSIGQILQSRDGIVYSLQLIGAGPQTLVRVNQLPWVLHCNVEQVDGVGKWHITVNDRTAAEHDLLRVVLQDPGVSVAGFSRKTYELEEIFMDLVRGANNDSKH